MGGEARESSRGFEGRFIGSVLGAGLFWKREREISNEYRLKMFFQGGRGRYFFFF